MCHHNTGDNFSSESYLVGCGPIQRMEITGDPVVDNHRMGFGGEILYEQPAPVSPPLSPTDKIFLDDISFAIS